MADTKISALPASTTPLAGTEVLPIVQSSSTKQVSVANLTAGRAISATQLTLTTGNLIVASGQGIDFSATPGTGTSELLDDYEEGAWTPAFNGTGTLTTATFTGSYTKVGRLVTCSAEIDIVDWGTFTVLNYISGLPFTADASLVTPCVVFKERFALGYTGTGRVVNPDRIDNVSYYDNSSILSTLTNRRVYIFTIVYYASSTP